MTSRPTNNKQQAVLDRMFLHRTCVQISSEQTQSNAEEEQRHVVNFVSKHCEAYPNEIVRVLVWRVMSSAPGWDRLGAWNLLNAVLAAGTTNRTVSAFLTDRIAVFLPHLARARWFGAQRLEENLIVKKPTGYTTINISEAPRDVTEKEIAIFYERILRGWRRFFVKQVAEDIAKAAEEVERGDNRLSQKVYEILKVPKEYEDSLWKLRRKLARPSTAYDVWKYYGGEGGFPLSDPQIESLAPMHPKVSDWLRKSQHHKGGDTFTDSWKYLPQTSPCTKAHIAGLKLISKEDAIRDLEGYGLEPRTAPLLQLTTQVLDMVTKHILHDEPFEEILTCLDSFRGKLSGSRERRALFIHASYVIYPSHTALAMRSIDDQPSAVRKAEEHFMNLRRHKEWKQLKDAILTIYESYSVREVTTGHKRALDDIKESRSFLFCLLDPAYPFANVRDSPCPDAVEKVAEVLPRISRTRSLRILLEHEKDDIENEELWDYYVAAKILEKYELLGARYNEESKAQIQDIVSSIKDKKDRQELKIAVKLVLEPHVQYCARMKAYGPSIKKKTARITLQHESISETEFRIWPELVEKKIRAYKQQQNYQRAEELQDVLKYLGGANLYPKAVAQAISVMTTNNIKLAAVRFAQDAVERALRRAGKSHMVFHLDTISRKHFPNVCIFCSSLLHHSGQHEQQDEEGRERVEAFLAELERSDVSLEEYCVGRNPKALRVINKLESYRTGAAAPPAALSHRVDYPRVLAGQEMINRIVSIFRNSLQDFRPAQHSRMQLTRVLQEGTQSLLISQQHHPDLVEHQSFLDQHQMYRTQQQAQEENNASLLDTSFLEENGLFDANNGNHAANTEFTAEELLAGADFQTGLSNVADVVAPSTNASGTSPNTPAGILHGEDGEEEEGSSKRKRGTDNDDGGREEEEEENNDDNLGLGGAENADALPEKRKREDEEVAQPAE